MGRNRKQNTRNQRSQASAPSVNRQKKRGFVAWFRRQDGSMKALVTTIIAGLLAGICSIFSAFAGGYGQAQSQRAMQPTPTIAPPALAVTEQLWNVNKSCLYAWPRTQQYQLPPGSDRYEYNGRNAWAVSATGNIKVQTETIRLKMLDQGYPAILLQSTQSVTILRVTLVVEAVQSPPPLSELQLVAMDNCAVGLASVPGVTFETVELEAHPTRYDLAVVPPSPLSTTQALPLPLHLDPNDRVIFTAPIYPSVDGEYIFHLEIEAVDPVGKSVPVPSSPTVHFRRLSASVQDLQQLPAILQPQ